MSDTDWQELAEEAAAMEQTMPTEGAVGPIVMALRRSWPSGGRPATGHWYAALDVGPFRGVWECGHSHTTEAGAWSCAKTALTIVVEEKGNPEHYTWDVDDAVDRKAS